jgi:hypothetical protein
MYLTYTIAYLLVAIFYAIVRTVGVCKIIISHRRNDACGKTSLMFMMCADLCVVTPCDAVGRPENLDKDIPLTSLGLKTEAVCCSGHRPDAVSSPVHKT